MDTEELIRLKNYIEFQIYQNKELLASAKKSDPDGDGAACQRYTLELKKLSSELNEVTEKLSQTA